MKHLSITTDSQLANNSFFYYIELLNFKLFLIKQETCFTKNNKSLIDLSLTKRPFYIQHAEASETGLSDFHILIFSFFKCQYSRLKPKVIHYRNYRNFNDTSFLEDLQNSTLREKCPYSEFFWSVFSCIRTEYGEILCISPHSIQMRENADQKNSKYRHFSYSTNLFISTKGSYESYSHLWETFYEIVQKHSPLKKKNLRSN